MYFWDERGGLGPVSRLLAWLGSVAHKSYIQLVLAGFLTWVHVANNW